MKNFIDKVNDWFTTSAVNWKFLVLLFLIIGIIVYLMWGAVIKKSIGMSSVGAYVPTIAAQSYGPPARGKGRELSDDEIAALIVQLDEKEKEPNKRIWIPPITSIKPIAKISTCNVNSDNWPMCQGVY